ncbi:hypothetical protein BKA66DRAFT_571476 [Pyrenochaeta sp. MPI-SDFR-AT-0127]|nr:hypothetical protein BKA66DRAFT_571476 [Pyrenochaeta sp. MPI-SDFR-AT-0127]
MNLLELPEDLLYLIASYFERDRRTLLALARACRDLNMVTRSLLFRHTDDLSIERIRLLERKINTDATLKAYVHSYPVHMEYGVFLDNGLQKSLGYTNLRELAFVSSYKLHLPIDLSLMTRMRRLNVGARGEDQDFQCGFLETHPFAQIRSITLVGNFTATEIMHFMLIPSIHTLRAKDIGLLRAPKLAASFATQMSTIISLSLVGDGRWSVELKTVQAIFSVCPQLRDLQCQVPVIASPSGDRIFRKSHVIGEVNPAALNIAFAPLRARLRRLSLLQYRYDVPYNGTHMDFSRFEELIDLEITSCCLLPPGAPCEARDELCGLLPASLRCLKLDFPRESGIFFHHLEGEPFLAQDPFSIPSARYKWIVELLRHKRTKYPGLTHINMQDPPGAVGYWHWRQVEWAAPTEICTLLYEVGVTLNVNISYPNPKSEMESWNNPEYKRKIGTWPWKHECN